MSTSLTVSKPGKAQLAEQISFTDEQTQLMKDTVAKGATANEFLLFMHLAQHYGLDPFLKEIWCLKYASNQPATVFTSRDGYLKIASRDPQMNGIQSDVVRQGDALEKLPDGQVRHTYGNPRGEIQGAYALVWRKDRAHPAYFYAPLSEYNTGNNPTWKKYPSAMIVKVAEAMALKRAFSISGLVTQEELGMEVDPAEELATGAVVLEGPKPEAPGKPAAGSAPAASASPSPAPATTSGPSEKDEREVAGHRTRLLYARSIAEVQQIWGEIPGRLKPSLVPDKDAAKVHVQKGGKQPAAPAEDLVAEFVQQPAVGSAPPLTSTQRTELTHLLSLPTIAAHEKAKLLPVLPHLDEVRAGQAIYKLLLAIEQREGRDGDKEMRQALHRFVGNYAEQLGSSEVDRLTVLYEDKGVHWITLRAELLSAKAGLQAVPA